MANANHYDLKTLADFFDRDVRTIQLWDEELKEKYGSARVERGQYDFVKFVKSRILFLEDQIEIIKNSGDEKLHHLKMDGQKTANKINDLKLRRLLGELISFDAARLAWLNETTIFRKNTLALIPKLTTALEGVTDKHKRQTIISELIFETLNMLGDLKPDITIEPEEEEEIIKEVEDSSAEESK